MKKQKGVIISAVTIVIVVIVFVTLRFFRDTSLTDIQKSDVIRIGYAVEVPYVFIKPGGEVTGAEPEVAKVIVSRMGIQRIEWLLFEFSDLIPELEAGRIDAVVAGMFITPERAERVNFSEPGFHVQEGLLVAAGNPHQLHSYAQVIEMPEIRIAVITGAVEETMFKKLGLNDSQLVRVPDALTGHAAVENGVAHGLALSLPSIQWMASQDMLGSTEMADPFEQVVSDNERFNGYGAVAFRREDKQLLAAWNSALKSFLGSPEHLQLIANFGFTVNELPGTITTREIISRP